jgi:LPXTG-site transpeptidase (sortase) family protein
LGIQDEFNPLLEGFKKGLGDILGATTWPGTGVVDESTVSLPNNLQATQMQLSLPSLHKQWQVYQGEQIGQDWVVGDTEVSRLPTEKGMVFYGHNTESVFGRVHTLPWGATAQLSDGQQTKTYRLAQTRVINSDYTPLEKIEYTDGELTLITCRDANSPLRVIFTFKLAPTQE